MTAGVLAFVLLAGGGGALVASARAAATCPGMVRQKTAGGTLNSEIRDHHQGPETEEMFLCSSEGGHQFRIEGPLGSGYSLEFSGLVFAGKQVAVEFGYGSIAERELWVINLATDRRVFKKVLPEVSAHPESLPVGRAVLKRDDSVAWTELVPNGTYEVLEHTGAGTKVLDSTHKVQRYSLELDGSTLHWRELNGEARSATLD